MITEHDVKRQLPMGKHHAIKCRNIAINLGFNPNNKGFGNATREIRKVLGNIRHKNGYPVLSGSVGYWVAESAEECLEAEATMRSYCISSALHARDIKRARIKIFENHLELLPTGQSRML